VNVRAPIRLLHVVGARPNFVKMAPVIASIDAWNAGHRAAAAQFEQILVHTGQHYDYLLSRVFLDQLAMPEPDEFLGVGSGSQAEQTARLLEALEPVISRHRPDLVLVPGDVNSTCAAAIAAAKLNVPVAHLEAGLRSRDRSMPEEINRIIADHVSELLLTTCADADQNLLDEGIPPQRTVRVGNTMIDALVSLLPEATRTLAETRHRLGMPDRPFVLVTLHRPSNVDEPAQLRRLLGALRQLARDVHVLFPMHLRTRERLAQLEGGRGREDGWDGLQIVEPLGYIEFLGLMARAAAVITDSGGVQEETTVLGVPCVTARTTTERPITITEGTNVLVAPADPQAILDAARAAVARGHSSPPPRINLWDGHAGPRVAQALAEWAGVGKPTPKGPRAGVWSASD
jgi:UDP-N-acetylglucosamine 2-epimerase (non-hydrolysing)